MGGYNLYNYVDNNSLIGVDPEGLEVDINYFSIKEPQYWSALNYKEKSDWFSVAGHGNATGGIYENGELRKFFKEKNKMFSVPVEELAARIKKHPRYKKGMNIELLGCFTGINVNPSQQYAQKLANILEVSVRGPDNTLWFHPDGRIQINGLISDPITNKEIIDEKRPGKFNVFNPK